MEQYKAVLWIIMLKLQLPIKFVVLVVGLKESTVLAA